MRIFLSILVLIFNIQSMAKSDGIREVVIEGISIDDSLLDYFNRNEIQEAAKSTKDWFVNKKYTVSIFEKNLETYEKLQVVFLTDDNNYKVKAISGLINYPDNITECYKKSEDIYLEIKEMLTDLKDMGKYEYDHNDDPESKIVDYALLNDNEDEVYIACYDYSDNYNGTDHLRIGVRLIEFSNFLINDAYN